MTHNIPMMFGHRYTLHHITVICLVCLAVIPSIAVFGQAVMRPQDSPSSIRFVIRNFGINVDGSLSGISGEVVFDPQRIQAARFDISVKSRTIQTGNRLRDDHLRKKDYLDVDGHPEIRFQSTSVVSAADPSRFTLEGKLTIKGTTRPVRIPFSAIKDGPGFRFKGEFQVNRRDFAVGGSSISLSDNLTIYLEVITR